MQLTAIIIIFLKIEIHDDGWVDDHEVKDKEWSSMWTC